MAERKEMNDRSARPVKRARKKVCQFCVDRAEFIDYKDVAKFARCESLTAHENAALVRFEEE